MKYFLFNALANNKRGLEGAKQEASKLNIDGEFVSVIDLNVKEFFDNLASEDEVYLCGGDGTLNHFANDIYGYDFKNPVYYLKCGSGNDFYKDVEDYVKDGLLDLRPFLKNLPLVKVNGIQKRFLNGIGYGIDGDTCLVGDNIKKENPDAIINYSSIAIKLLLGGFDTKNATIEADGKTYNFKNVWLSSAMNGRYYGGGMNAAPAQDRLHSNKKVTVTTLSSFGRLITLLRFPSFSAGKHNGKKFINHIVASKVKVSFDKPCALQIDGETVENVLSYEVEFD